MKILFTIFALVFILNIGWGQQQVIPDSVQYFAGKTITVCAKVADTFVTKSEKKITHLNFEHAYPNQTFSVTIFESDLPKFAYVPSEFLKEKNVCVTGSVKMYAGRAEIIVNSDKQLKVQ